jgi:divalent metal cation (Fe/Co/Zn/Cd) transporter
MSVADAHIVSGKVKSAIRQQMSEVANVLIHIEPAQERTA